MTELAALSVPASRTWTICMLAHVDHGKSALSDCIISANGIVSTRMAGKLRYMDSRADEQLRGITMKSSSIALGYRPSEHAPLRIVHLVDSPGHVDFSGEVEAALRVCDGALLVVDVVEGVCVQTVTVLRAALEHAVRPVLVLNKLDRLFTELNLTPIEAYRRIQVVIEQVNVIMGIREVEEMMQAANLAEEEVSEPSEWTLDEEPQEQKKAESGYFSPELGNVVFASAIDGWAFRVSDFAKIFSTRFGISEKVLQRTLWGEYYLQQKSKRIIRKKTSAIDAKSEPMFARFVLSSIHSIYDTIESTQNDLELAVKRRAHIVSKLGLTINNRDLKHRDTSVVIQSIMSAWLPAARTLLDAVTDKLPSVSVAQADEKRLSIVWPHRPTDFDNLKGLSQQQDDESRRKIWSAYTRQRAALHLCDSSEDAPVIVLVTKMIEGLQNKESATSSSGIRMPRSREELAAARELANAAKMEKPSDQDIKNSNVEMIAFARVLSGTLKPGMKLYAYSPKYAVHKDGSYDQSSISEMTITKLFLLMGRGTEGLRSASVGAIVGIAGADEAVLKAATLSTEPPGVCLPSGVAAHSRLQRDTVVRVAVEPNRLTDIGELQKGLRKLNQADPSVETMVTSSGEYVVAANGELHLERCLNDLRDRFAKGISIHVSKPIVSFRETVVGGSSPFVAEDREDNSENFGTDGNTEPRSSNAAQVNEGKQDLKSSSNSAFSLPSILDKPFMRSGKAVVVSSPSFSFRAFAVALPTNLANVLDKVGSIVRSRMQSEQSDERSFVDIREHILDALHRDSIEEQTSKVSAVEFEDHWRDIILPRVLSCGPRRFGANLLIGPCSSENISPDLKSIFWNAETSSINSRDYENPVKDLENALGTGFQLGVQSGPLTEEPMHGVAIFLDNVCFLSGDNNNESKQISLVESEFEEEERKKSSGTLSGLAIGLMKEATRKAVLQGNARLMEAVLHVDISVTNDALGRTYTVIGKRRGRVLDEKIRDGVNIFGIEAFIPVVESFGFADELRKQTSGFAVPQMIFSHWETIGIDPFWEPRTEEELEDLGSADTTAENNNLARKLMNSVRRRKGLKVDEKIVEKAEKQRTLSRKK